MIDPLTGALAYRGCPQKQEELFLSGTLPETTCPIDAVASDRERRPGAFSRTLKRIFGR
jgi:hypothetical protein